MSTEKHNPGLEELYKVARKDYEPYSDRLRSTNTRVFVPDTLLNRKPEEFKKDELIDSLKLNFVPTKFGS